MMPLCIMRSPMVNLCSLGILDTYISRIPRSDLHFSITFSLSPMQFPAPLPRRGVPGEKFKSAKCNHVLPRAQHYPETVVVVPIVRIVAAPVRSAEVALEVAPRAAAQRPLCTFPRPNRVYQCTNGDTLNFVPIIAPFRHVTGNVVQPKCIRQLCRNLMCAITRICSTKTH